MHCCSSLAPSGAVTGRAGLSLAAASGAVASGLGYAVWYSALPALGPTRGAVVQLSVPVLAALGGIFFLDETVTARWALSATAILGGIALVIRGAPARRPAPAMPPR